MSTITKHDVEQATLQWLSEPGWSIAHGSDVSSPDARTPGEATETVLRQAESLSAEWAETCSAP